MLSPIRRHGLQQRGAQRGLKRLGCFRFRTLRFPRPVLRRGHFTFGNAVEQFHPLVIIGLLAGVPRQCEQIQTTGLGVGIVAGGTMLFQEGREGRIPSHRRSGAKADTREGGESSKSIHIGG